MKIKLSIVLCMILLVPGSVHAQIDFQPGPYSMVYSSQPMEPKLVEVIDGVATLHYTLNNSAIQGSTYLSEDFVDGAMTAADGTRIEGLKLRYDIYNDKMQLLLKQDTALINRPLALKFLELGNKKFIYDVYQISEHEVAAGYFEVLHEDNLSLLFRRELELEYDSFVPNYGGGGGTKNIKLKNNNNLYVKLDKSTARKIYKKKDFLQAITAHNIEVKDFIKEHQISVRKQNDLKELVLYYNTLLPN